MIELTIKVRDESQVLKVKHLLHFPLNMDPLDATLEGLIKDAIEAFQGVKPPESVTITAKLEV